MVCRAVACYGLLFKTGHGVTQGGPVFPTIVNLMVDTIICEWERLLILKRILLDEIYTFIAIC